MSEDAGDEKGPYAFCCECNLDLVGVGTLVEVGTSHSLVRRHVVGVMDGEGFHIMGPPSKRRLILKLMKSVVKRAARCGG